MATSGSTEEDDYYFGNDDFYSYFVNPKKTLPIGVHKPNKNEAKLLRKLKAETGLSEVELRKEKKYRIMLSTAQDKGEKSLNFNDKIEKRKKGIMKIITKKMKLAKEHPLVIEEYKKKLKEYPYLRSY